MRADKQKSGRKYLIISSVGDDSLHEQWLYPSEFRNFDICLHYFGSISGRYSNQCDYYFESPGFKWKKLKEIIQVLGDKINQYDAIWLPDDDIRTDARNISYMFEIFSEQGFELAQPALTADSYIAHYVTRINPAYKWRYSHFVECMIPLFSNKAFKKCWPSFEKSTTGFGLDLIWPKILGYPINKIAVIDETPVTHARPQFGGTLYKSAGKDPWNELSSIEQEFQVDRSILNLPHYDGVPNNHNLLIVLIAHEKKKVLKKQIENIRFFNPAAGIILYNGGTNKELAKNLDIAECPSSVPLKWGNLTRVLLDVSIWLKKKDVKYEYLVCFDHDVLFVKHGFERFLNHVMKDLDSLGWRLRIQSRGDKLPPSHETSMQKERHIWKHILGTDNLHYYFNNGQVFRRGIINKILSSINYSEVTRLIDETEVFALEEMFFVTRAAACGGKIGEYPNGHHYNEAVHNDKEITIDDFNYVINKTDYYWIHPVKGKRLRKLNKKLFGRGAKSSNK
ncbi:hypothetical protein [Cytobacillus pseudoceanisediminis]|uniref:hypothetical protein n=1 Tax=Cytobacillus pseudoceanisediminis TaxID=3051614 RepID=UPI003C30D975